MVRFIVGAVLALSLRAVAADPATPFREPRPTGRARDAEGVTLALGHVTYAFASGMLFELAAPDGAPCGFLFEGKGTLTWREEDAEAAHVFGKNAQRLGGFDAVKGGTLAAPVTRASFWLSKGALKESPAFDAEGEPGDRLATHLRRFARDQMTPPTLGLAGARLEAALFSAVMAEGKRDLRHEVDGVFSGGERLAVVAAMEAAPVGFVDWRLARTVASAVVGRPLREPPEVRAVLTDLDVDVREGNDGWGELVAVERYVPAKEIRSLALKLSSETLGHRGLSTRPTALSSVIDEKGRALAFALEKDALLVVLAEPAPAGVPLRLRFAYRAGFFEPPVGSGVWELSLEQGWYPAPVAFRNGCRFTYHAVVRARKPLVPFTSGETVRRDEDGAFQLVETRLARPVATVGVFAGPYHVVSETRGGATVRIASYTLPKPKATARLCELVALLRGHYESLLGPCPWKDITIAERSEVGFGQATDGVISATREAFYVVPRRTRDGHLLPEGFDRHIAHEMAHAWFGYRVIGASERDQWIEEAFATFLSVQAIEALGDDSEARRAVNIWRERASESRKEAPIWLASEMSHKASLQPAHDAARDRYALLYFKGATLLAAIRKEVGDDRFFGALRAFLEACSGPVTTADFVAFLSERTEKDWKPFFERYFFGTALP